MGNAIAQASPSACAGSDDVFSVILEKYMLLYWRDPLTLQVALKGPKILENQSSKRA